MRRRAGRLDLPWATGRRFAVGEWARRRAADAPQRTVGAAKSWLCHSRVDRRQPILPWNAPSEVEKISPVTAAQYYLDHLVSAWDAEHPDAPLAQQCVVLTVPASFDAAARELTREAALAAGLPADLILLEEPQAAVYAWLAALGDGWRKSLKVGDRVLICDVGGGTTDLTLVEACETEGELQLQRLAVGDHLLVGGDNMDLALGVSHVRAICHGRTSTGSLAVGGVVARLPHREGIDAGRQWPAIAYRIGARAQQSTYWRHGLAGDRTRCRGPVAGGRVLSALSDRRSAAASEAHGVPRNRFALRTGHGHHATLGRVSDGPCG